MQQAKQNVFRDFMTRQPLVVALLLSLLIHSGFFGFWKLGKHFHWWDHQATWLLTLLQKKPKPLDMQKLIQKQLQEMAAAQQKREIPLTFMEVDPTTLALEPPKDAKYYGALNARAANPDPVIETLKPKIDGKQEKVARTEKVTKAQPLQPSAPPEKSQPKQPENTLKPSEKPKAEDTPGDLAMAKPAEKPKPADPDATEMGTVQKPKEKPRTLAAARAQKNLVGEPMKQPGGTRQRGSISFDVKQTPFGAYDAAFIAAVQQRWFDLLESTQFAQRPGRVVIEFKLTYEGRILEMKVNRNEVGELLGLLCQRAISDPAPYPPWPSDMRRLVGSNFREVTFAFDYE